MTSLELLTDRGGRPRPDRLALPVATVRAREAAAMASLPAGTLMARASAGVETVCARWLRAGTGAVTGRRVTLLVGSGDNGGDALYAGAGLARRGAAVTALLLAGAHHAGGAAALRGAGGRLLPVAPDLADALLLAGERVRASDLVVDGILGIGGRGGLRPAAAALAAAAADEGVTVVAVDLPSGLDADTGQVEGAAVSAAATVVLGVLKPGLLLAAGPARAGAITVVDIGLDLAHAPDGLRVADDALAAAAVPRPAPSDDKYSRGVAGVSAGSARYPGAAVLATGAARHGAAGFVRYAGAAAAEVVRRWPDVVASYHPVAAAGRVQCWLVGPGRGTDDDAVAAVRDALAGELPVVLDADALTVLAEHAELRTALRERDPVTVLTPHAGEFARVQGALGLDQDVASDPVGAVRAMAAELSAVVLLKGATTVVVTPGGEVRLAVAAPPELATAGSGDVLAGLLGSLLAHAQAARPRGQLDGAAAAAVVAAGAHLHGVAGALAAAGGRPVAAFDVLAALPAAVAQVRAATDG